LRSTLSEPSPLGERSIGSLLVSPRPRNRERKTRFHSPTHLAELPVAHRPVTSSPPISARSSQQHRRRQPKNLGLTCQPESRTAKVCRLPVARARPSRDLRNAICRRCSSFPPRLPALPHRRNAHTRKSQDPPSIPKYSKPAPGAEKTWNASAAVLQRFFHILLSGP